MRAAIYARFSTDKQSPTSAEDQVRECRQRAAREGWSVDAVFVDEATSGTTRDRTGLNELMLRAGQFDIVLAESLDRLSRDQEDIAWIHKRLRFAGATIVTLQDGAIGEIHIGLKGTMAALFLADLGQKTRRGQIGVVHAGRIPGGLSYGYRKVIDVHDGRGELVRGLRAIDEDEAAIVRRIFADFLAGVSALEIAKRLNAEGVPAPRGGQWRQNTVMGHRRRRNGILCNDLYAGRIVFNRQRMIRDPASRRRVSRTNPRDQWVTNEVPELRIVDQETFDAVQARLERNARDPVTQRRRPRRLFSGLLRCGGCGGPMTVVSADRWGCATRKEKGGCANGRTIVNAQLEKRLLGALRDQMLAPDVLTAFVTEYHLQRARNARSARKGADKAQARIVTLEARISRWLDMAGDGELSGLEYRAKADPAQAEIARLRAKLASIDEPDPVPRLEPGIRKRYRDLVDQLGRALERAEPLWDEAKDGLRALVDQVRVHPRQDGRGVELELVGRLAEVLLQAQKKPAPEGTGQLYVSLVAGVRSTWIRTISTIWC